MRFFVRTLPFPTAECFFPSLSRHAIAVEVQQSKKANRETFNSYSNWVNLVNCLSYFLSHPEQPQKRRCDPHSYRNMELICQKLHNINHKHHAKVRHR